MSILAGPTLVDNGLVVNLDAANSLSLSGVSSNWGNLVNPTTPDLTQVEVLVVAGGGSGSYTGSGGGAGGLIYNQAFSVTSNPTYTVTVGAGGTLVPGLNQGNNGGNSTFGALTAIGGGAGKTHGQGTGAAGGSGGGAAQVSTGGPFLGGAATSGQGFPGGGVPAQVSGWTGGSGGGGGAGGNGADGGVNILGAGNGGQGLYFPQFAPVGGSPAGWFAGGGGAGEVELSFTATGGLGGGGSGGSNTAGQNGVANTGGGGGGGGYAGLYYSGAVGGSGIVIVRYPLPIRATGGTITVVGDHAIHTFTSGTSNFVVSRSAALINNPVYNSDVGGNLVFNGSSKYAEYTDSINFDNDFTVSLIVKSSNYVLTAGILTKTDVGSYSSVKGFSITNISNPQTVYVWASNGVSTKTIQLSALNMYNWTEITVTKTSSTLTAYTNGILIGSVDITGFGSINGTQNLFLGKGNSAFWAGSMAALKIYNRALSITEVQQNFNALRSRYSI